MGSELGISTVLGWAVDIGLVVAVFFLFQRQSLKASRWQATLTERLGRWKIVTDLESDIINLHATKWALQKVQPKNGGDEQVSYLELRHVLDNDPDWTYDADPAAKLLGGFRQPRSITPSEAGARYWKIREFRDPDGNIVQQYLASPAFHESLVWFRKVDRAIRYGVLLPEELADWWRQILPMGWSGRLEYLSPRRAEP
jgi:hypothetical protein